ncbi:MAG: hypothetical protein ABEH88_05065 [Halobacteriales archaeon]
MGVPEGTVALTSLVASPYANPVQIDPGVVTDSSRPIRAAVSLLVVTLIGQVLQVRYGGLLDRAVNDVRDRPRVAVIYGVVAYGILAFSGFFLNNVLVQSGTLDTPLAFIALILVTLSVLVLSSFGFLVVGTVLVDLRTGHLPWQAPVLGGVVSAVPWLVLPFVTGVVAWLAVAAFGVGGRTRTWVHSSRTVESDR